MSAEIACKQNILVTDFHLLKSLLVVLGFGSQAFICGFSRQNICSEPFRKYCPVTNVHSCFQLLVMTTLLKLAPSLIILTGPLHYLEAKTQKRSDLSGSLSKQPLQPLNTVSSLELQVHNEEVICSYHMHGLHQRPDIGSGASSPRFSASTAQGNLLRVIVN